MPLGYPIVLDLSRSRVVIVGGGAVAARKAAGVLAAGAAQLRAVAPKFVKDFPAAVERILETFEPRHLDGANLAFAATDSATANDAVVDEARKRGIWVNRADADDEDPGDFSTPALGRFGPITVAVTAGSPALAAALRDQLAGAIGNEWVNLAEALVHIRPTIKSSNLPITKRREILRSLATADAATAATGGESALWEWTVGKFPELK
ncbi:MAG: bifunctional precorrin-2 dehydrogenase/sirohydrochlorin ferrochelatase [Tepidisphaeraceae bacterium]|jgi:precorrin-2 dehydrogenase/sirohydrochlorin ferrochelatase